MANEFYVPNAGNTQNWDISLDNTRRIWNLGNEVASLAPEQKPFFTYLTKVRKKPTDDPVFKFLEQRHQWQRRNFDIKGPVSSTSYTANTEVTNAAKIDCGYDEYGKINAGSQPKFLIEGQVVAIVDSTGAVRRFLVSGTPDLSTAAEAELDLTPLFTATAAFSDNAKGQVIGSAFAEATGAPNGWSDKLYDREGYAQIFKNACQLYSGTSMATRFRGISDEFQRRWTDIILEHAMDIEQTMLFGVGRVEQTSNAEDAGTTRYSWGIIPYTESYGKVYNMTYASSGYDAFLDAMEDFFAPEGGNSGNKLVLASRKVITYLNKMGSGSFLNNTVGSSQYRLDVQNIKGAFGHNVTVVDTIFGNLHFVAEPLLRGPWEDYCACVDLKNVSYCPLSANGRNRDTFIETNVQANDIDGRKDQIITEAGLRVDLPETHAVLKFS